MTSDDWITEALTVNSTGILINNEKRFIEGPSHYRRYNLWLYVLDKTPLSFNYHLTSLCELVVE